MEENSIPKKLLDKYNIFKIEHLKYSVMHIENCENEVNKENSMLDSLKIFLKSLENLSLKISEFILSNKNTFNDTCKENEIKSLDYIFIIKSSIYLINSIISKLGNKEAPEETFQSIYNKLYQEFQKIFEVQYPKNEGLNNLETYITSVIDYSINIKKSTNKPGNILTSLVVFCNLKFIKDLNGSIQKFESIKEFKDSSFFNNKTQSHEIILFDLLILLKKLKSINTYIYYGYLLEERELINQKEESDECRNIKKLIWGVKLKKDIDIEKRCKEIFEKNMVRFVSMSQMRKGEVSKFKMIGNMVTNLFTSSNQAEYNAKKKMIQLYGFIFEPPKKTMKFNSFMKKMIKSRFPAINFRTKLYLKKEFKPITLEYIKELNDFMNGKMSEPKDKDILLFNNDYKLSEEISNKKLFNTQLDKKEKDLYISTRLMNNNSFKIQRREKYSTAKK